ncbi:uncharacterized protein LOC134624787 isoform X2 [Pelmatolapia mariae]|uniref:uncharacterized protein LOC134624787 isoform X2 n=1 Tax=Pelmatolapia mariae TaxID=158779 RepID=UPI003211F180
MKTHFHPIKKATAATRSTAVQQIHPPSSPNSSLVLLSDLQLSNRRRRVWWCSRGTISAIWTQLSHYRGNNVFNTKGQTWSKKSTLSGGRQTSQKKGRENLQL